MSAEQDDLMELWLEGSLDAEQEAELAIWLQENPEHMQRFVEANVSEQLLRAAVLSESVKQEVLEAAPPFPARSARTGRRAVAFLVGLAACLLIAYVSIPKQNATPPQADLKPFASIAMVDDNNSTYQVGERLGAETFEIESGVARLLFDDGVEVTLQGPARYELAELGKTVLHSGLLTATVPGGAEGFCVDTASMQVIDLGTAFGVQQREDGTSGVCVFDGEVEVLRPNAAEKRLLTEGQSLRLDSAGSVSEIDLSAETFEKLWPAASGIVGSSGAFEFAPQWPRRLNRLESDTQIFVRPEGYPGALEQDCRVDTGPNDLADSTIPSGTRLRSFLLQFNPVDPAGDESSFGPGKNWPPGQNGRRIQGSITFEKPIIGVISSTENLRDSDALFSAQRFVAMFGRGLETKPPRIADRVTLSEDGRTLTLDLFVVHRLSDHVRVLVDASIAEDEIESAIASSPGPDTSLESEFKL